jgi:hypothetical protein
MVVYYKFLGYYTVKACVDGNLRSFVYLYTFIFLLLFYEYFVKSINIFNSMVIQSTYAPTLFNYFFPPKSVPRLKCKCFLAKA